MSLLPSNLFPASFQDFCVRPVVGVLHELSHLYNTFQLPRSPLCHSITRIFDNEPTITSVRYQRRLCSYIFDSLSTQTKDELSSTHPQSYLSSSQRTILAASWFLHLRMDSNEPPTLSPKSRQLQMLGPCSCPDSFPQPRGSSWSKHRKLVFEPIH